jgi:pyruvate formate lyase activating enzyme
VARRQTLVVGGLTPFTTIDFPGRLAAVIFCQGCSWRCAYCHNPHLLPPRSATAQSWPALVSWLDNRRGLLDGVVFSGGEPLLQRGLADAVGEVRALGFAVALHTAGAYPQRLKALLPGIDWVGFDVKAPFDAYRPITGCDGGERARQSLAILIASGTPYEVRCTVDERVLDDDGLCRMADQLASLGTTRLVLQTRRDATGKPALPDRLLTDRLAKRVAKLQFSQSDG